MSADAALSLLKKGKQQQADTLESLIPLVHTLGVINADLSLVQRSGHRAKVTYTTTCLSRLDQHM